MSPDFEEKLYAFDAAERKGGQVFTAITIPIGGYETPRSSCANHKSNVAVVGSIENNPELCNDVTLLSSCASDNKKSLYATKIFICKRARLKINNKTRWSSVFLMLASFHKAYMRG